MKTTVSNNLKFLSSLLVMTIIFNNLAVPIFSQEKPIVISIGQPNIWSLEQAHYLLARMHRQNLDLQTTSLGDLDPNAANAQRVTIVKQLISAGFKFDDAVRINNQLLKSDKSFNSQRRQDLLAQRTSLQSQRTQISREISELKILKSKSTDDNEKTSLNGQIEAKTEAKTAVEDELDKVNDELSNLSSASGDFKGTEPTTEGFDATKLPSSDLEELLPDQAAKSSIAASQRLENHVGMQYEIIAKQLSLLRDEVGPGERLIFLELPQSINISQEVEKNKYLQAMRGIAGMSTNDSANNKMAQVWWRIDGYSKVNKAKVFESELNEIKKKIDQLNLNILNSENVQITFVQRNENLVAQRNQLNERLVKLSADRDSLDKTLEALQKEGKQEEIKRYSEQNRIINNSLRETQNAIKETTEAIQIIDDLKFKIMREKAKLSQSLTGLYVKYEKLKIESVRQQVKEQQNETDRLLQGGGSKTSEITDKTIKLIYGQTQKLTNLKSETTTEREYVKLDILSSKTNSPKIANDSAPSETNKSVLRNRSVRVIDIIPRQNAVNVDTTKESVKATGVVAAFSFLFGFGGNVHYQRQREQFDQFLNLELYTSGFGKGDTDFGWSFYPFANTKQLAPGVRTTYAVAIIPDDAESVVLKARGCYFPRKEKQPLDYEATANWNNETSSNCSEVEQNFVVPIPGSGDGSDFYVTGVWYTPAKKSGERMVAQLYGENFSPQTGVMVNGVPLVQSVGLAQTGVESILGNKVEEKCVSGAICGRFERIDSKQIVISFSMPEGFSGTPKISLIAPGKAIEINSLNLNINGSDDVKLIDSDFMFGKKPIDVERSIDDLKVAPDPTNTNNTLLPLMMGVLNGKFQDNDTFYVNGSSATIIGGVCKTTNLCIIQFPTQKTDFLTVTVVPTDRTKEAISKTFVNPSQLKILSATVSSYVKATANNPAILTVKIDGSGFSDAVTPLVNAPGSIERKLVPSSGQMVLEIKSPAPIVQITLTDTNTNNSVSTIVLPAT